ncbi:Pathogenesis-related protein 1B [Colletotrichum chlorophyti]|uniref:Pathogenesis-related protein 1B n=1 Tax=Colletotrichum chlorophyti TaxID=708187 RepID=A0A1Q8S5L4_9PEZI|nr:Pathogenesis-related protein 1B [Colletotrichum chlorophyti]
MRFSTSTASVEYSTITLVDASPIPIPSFSTSSFNGANSTSFTNSTIFANSTASLNGTTSGTSSRTTLLTTFVTSSSLIQTSTDASPKPSSTSSSPVATSTSPSTPGLTADQQRALDLHNQARAAVGNPPLTWDSSLAASAQAWADHLTSVGSLEHDTNPGGQGENLASQWGAGTNTFYANGVQLWLDEKPLYDNQPIRTTGSPNYLDYGHYTQAIWKDTKRVGLAIATDSKGTTFLVARYSPGGNIVGSMPY